jgi:hypothetical protein
MSQFEERFREIAARTQREARSLPLAQRRERHAQGMAQQRRLVASNGVQVQAVARKR